MLLLSVWFQPCFRKNMFYSWCEGEGLYYFRKGHALFFYFADHENESIVTWHSMVQSEEWLEPDECFTWWEEGMHYHQEELGQTPTMPGDVGSIFRSSSHLTNGPFGKSSWQCLSKTCLRQEGAQSHSTNRKHMMLLVHFQIVHSELGLRTPHIILSTTFYMHLNLQDKNVKSIEGNKTHHSSKAYLWFWRGQCTQPPNKSTNVLSQNWDWCRGKPKLYFTTWST